MKFRKRMKPIVKQFVGKTYEAVDWYHSENIAKKKAKEYETKGFLTRVILEPEWKGWFVYISG